MKEKLKSFFRNGGIYLVLCWCNIGMLLGWITESVLDRSIRVCVIYVFIYLPWIFLFFSLYKFQKETTKVKEDRKFLVKTIYELAGERDRYKELYGDLPEEETKEKSHDTDK